MQRLSLSLALAFSLSFSSRAEAQSTTPGSVITPIAIGVGAVGLTIVGFSIADTVSFAQGTPFDDALAATDLVLGTIALGAGVAGLAWGTTNHGDLPGLIGVATAAIALGAYQSAHGCWSLWASRRPHGTPPPSVAFSPTEGGGLLTLAGAF